MSEDTSVLDEELVPLQPGDGRIGRLARSGRIPIGYYKDEAKTAATFRSTPDGVRWSLPGDLASVEPDGTVIVLGRGSDCINSGGEKIFPEEVEAAVSAIPACRRLVVGCPTSGSASGWRWWSSRGGAPPRHPRGPPGPLSYPRGRLQGPPPAARREAIPPQQRESPMPRRPRRSLTAPPGGKRSPPEPVASRAERIVGQHQARTLDLGLLRHHLPPPPPAPSAVPVDFPGSR